MSDHGLPAVPRALRAPIERPIGLLQGLAERTLGPFDAIFDLLEQSGAVRAVRAPAEIAKGLAGLRPRDR